MHVSCNTYINSIKYSKRIFHINLSLFHYISHHGMNQLYHGMNQAYIHVVVCAGHDLNRSWSKSASNLQKWHWIRAENVLQPNDKQLSVQKSLTLTFDMTLFVTNILSQVSSLPVFNLKYLTELAEWILWLCTIQKIAFFKVFVQSHGTYIQFKDLYIVVFFLVLPSCRDKLTICYLLSKIQELNIFIW